jgi:hypothetical protein
MLPVAFEPTISAGERPKTYALDRAATGTESDRDIQSPVALTALQNIWFLYRFSAICRPGKADNYFFHCQLFTG